MIYVELVLFLFCILLGSRLGGIGMGAMGAIGLMLFVFGFHLPPGSPPVTVLGMILAVITALSTMDAAGGLDFLVGIAEKVMRKRPQNITFIAPLVTYLLVMLSGTQHVIYALLPVISEISRKSGVRVERPMSATVIASMMGLIASPISAATVALLGTLVSRSVSLGDILMVTIPASLLGTVAAILSVMWKGENPAPEEDVESIEVKEQSQQDKKRARGTTYLFFTGVLLVVVLGLIPDLRPHYQLDGVEQQLKMAPAIMMLMMAIAGLNMLFFKASPQKAVASPTMKSGIVAVISIMGISWLGSSFFEGNEQTIVSGISELIAGREWMFGIGLFALSVLLFSQAATIVTLMPVAVSLGLKTSLIVGLYPAVSGLFFLPTYGTILAAVSFDATKSTRIGKFLVNHSFMVPGLAALFVAVSTSLLISNLLL